MDIEFRKLRRAIWNVFREYYLSYAVIAFYFSFPRDPSFSRVLFLHLPLSILCPKKIDINLRYWKSFSFIFLLERLNV